jgi:hypothetical protein
MELVGGSEEMREKGKGERKERNLTLRSYAGYVQDEMGQTEMYADSDSDVERALKQRKTKKDKQNEKNKQDEEDRERMAMDLLNAKTRRVYPLFFSLFSPLAHSLFTSFPRSRFNLINRSVKSIKGRLERAEAMNENLMAKRVAIEKQKKKEAREAMNAVPSTPATTSEDKGKNKGKGKKRKEGETTNDKPAKKSKK